jgi:hypothetical protein
VIALPFGIGTNGHPIANGLTGGLLVAFVVNAFRYWQYRRGG